MDTGWACSPPVEAAGLWASDEIVNYSNIRKSEANWSSFYRERNDVHRG